MSGLLSFSPSQSNEQLGQSRALISAEEALKYRRYRVWLSQAKIEPIQWVVICLVAALIMVTIAAIHVEKKRATSLFAFSSAIAICLVLLLDYDHPFGRGDSSIPPTQYIEAMPK